MAPIRLAVIFEQTIYDGGGYQQSVNAALLTRKLSPDLVKTLFFTTRQENIVSLANHGIDVVYLGLSFYSRVRRLLNRFIKNIGIRSVLPYCIYHDPLEKQLLDRNIDLVYFLSPSGQASRFDKLNYLTTVWDLCHRDDPEFPEVRLGGEFEAREKNFRAILPRATAVLVDSEQGRINVVRRYGIDPERVWVMPFEAAPGAIIDAAEYSSGYIDIAKRYNLNIPYVFYPAQFWAHKNHVYILDGLRDLESRHNMRVGAIFTGSDQGNLDYVKEYANKLMLDDRIRFAGFVPNQEIPYLYRQSLALVMPSYFGPTNLPPLEAFHLGTPVLYSDKLGLREQVGDAALLMDLKDPSTLANHLARLANDSNFRQHLINAGRLQIDFLACLDRVHILESLLDDFRWRRHCWK